MRCGRNQPVIAAHHRPRSFVRSEPGVTGGGYGIPNRFRTGAAALKGQPEGHPGVPEPRHCAFWLLVRCGRFAVVPAAAFPSCSHGLLSVVDCSITPMTLPWPRSCVMTCLVRVNCRATNPSDGSQDLVMTGHPSGDKLNARPQMESRDSGTDRRVRKVNRPLAGNTHKNIGVDPESGARTKSIISVP